MYHLIKLSFGILFRNRKDILDAFTPSTEIIKYSNVIFTTFNTNLGHNITIHFNSKCIN